MLIILGQDDFGVSEYNSIVETLGLLSFVSTSRERSSDPLFVCS